MRLAFLWYHYFQGSALGAICIRSYISRAWTSLSLKVQFFSITVRAIFTAARVFCKKKSPTRRLSFYLSRFDYFLSKSLLKLRAVRLAQSRLW